MRLRGVVLLACALPVAPHGSAGCVHDEVMANLNTIIPHKERQLRTMSAQEYHVETEHGRVLQSSYAPIRIVLDTSRLYLNG